MKFLIASLLVATVVADRLENTYLPPHNAKTAAGNGNFLSAPSFGSSSSSGATSGFSSSFNKVTNFGSGVSSIKSGAVFNNKPFSTGSFGASGFKSASANVFGGFNLKSNTRPTSYNLNTQNDYSSNSKYSSFYSQSPEARAAIVKSNNDNNGDGSYRFSFETENKIKRQEHGESKNYGHQESSSVVQGSYSYVGDDGKVYSVNYNADENGFHASGDHIPTPPPIPEAIQKSLQLNAASTNGKQVAYNNQGVYNQETYSNQGTYKQASSNNLGVYKQGAYNNQGASNQGVYNNGAYNNAVYNNQGVHKTQTSYNNQGAFKQQYQTASRQYLAPSKPSFNIQTGYQY